MLSGCDKFCFHKAEKENISTVSFDLLNLSENKNISVIRGLPTRYFISKSNSAFYEPEVYLDNEQKSVINFHAIKGNPQLYIYNSRNIIENNNKEFNGFITGKYQDQIKAKVDCGNNDCVFDLEIKNINERSYLYPGFIFQAFLSKEETDKYKLLTNTEAQNDDYMIIYIFYLIQSPKVSIYNDGNKDIKFETISLTDNIISCNISFDKVKNENIVIDITATNSGLFYGVYYDIKKRENLRDIPLISGLVNLLDLRTIDITKGHNFVFRYRNYLKYNQLFIEVNTFSNNLSIDLNGNYYPQNNLIDIVLEENQSLFKLLNNEQVLSH